MVNAAADAIQVAIEAGRPQCRHVPGGNAVPASTSAIASLRWCHINETDEEIRVEMSWEGPLKARTYDDDEDEDEDAARVVPLSDELVAHGDRRRPR